MDLDVLYFEESTPYDVDSSDLDYGDIYTCPNCGESYDGIFCHACHYSDLY